MRPAICILFFAAVLGIAWPAAAQTPIVVTSGAHEGVWTAEHVEWTSRFDPEYLPAARDGRRDVWRLDLAIPLPDDAVVRSAHEALVEPVRDGTGQIVALNLSSDAAVVPTALLTSLPRDGALDPPLARDALQRVELFGATVRPVAGSPLELRLADIRHVELDTADRQRLADRWGRPDSPRPVVLVADEAFVASGGLTPSIEVEDRSGVFVALGLTLVFFLVVLVAAIRLGGRHVRHEEANAFLREHEPSLADL